MQEFIDKGLLPAISFLFLVKYLFVNSQIWNYKDKNTHKLFYISDKKYKEYIQILEENGFITHFGEDKIKLNQLKDRLTGDNFYKTFDKFLIIDENDRVEEIKEKILVQMIRKEMEKQETLIERKKDYKKLTEDSKISIFTEIKIKENYVNKLEKELNQIDNENSSFPDDDQESLKRKLTKLKEELKYLYRFKSVKYCKKLLKERDVLDTFIEENILFSYQFLSTLFHITKSSIFRIIKKINNKKLLIVEAYRKFCLDINGNFIHISPKNLENNLQSLKEHYIGHLYVDRNGHLCQIIGSTYKVLPPSLKRKN